MKKIYNPLKFKSTTAGFFQVIIILVFSSVSFGLFAQNKSITIKGSVVDEKNKRIEFATILCQETQLNVLSDEKGNFSFSIPVRLDQVNIKVTAVGRRSVEKRIESKDFASNIHIVLLESSLTLKEIDVSSTYSKSKNSISSITFDEEAIERVQAFSLMDVLNTLPGKQLSAPNINSPQTLTLRNTLGGTYGLNNSLGIPIIVDGVRLSNDGNMQSRPVTQRGMGGSTLPAVGGGNTADVPFTGIDLREIPVESIESIEVIQGVASAEYGELTDGAIIIQRKAGASPLQFTTNINGGSTNYSLNKGFNLPNKLGGITTDFNYAISNVDPRDKVQEYKRYGAAVRWRYNLKNILTNKFSIDYNRKIDDAKTDPDDDLRKKYYSKQVGMRFSNTTDFHIKSKFLSNVNLTLSYSESNQESYSQQIINQSNKGYTAKDTTGIYEGILLSAQYLAVEEIIGRPITASGNLRFSSLFNIGSTLHSLSYGLNNSYANNGGKGVISDPERPRFVNFNGTNIRPYSFELTPSMINSGLYFTDNISYKVFGKDVRTNLGVRFDSQNGSTSVQPRLGTQVYLNKHWNFGLAYGVSTKSPTLAHRYPPPAWIDIPLALAFNSEASLYLVYTEKFESANPNLKPSKSTQGEFTLNFENKTFSSRLNAYYKGARDGFNSFTVYQPITLPNFDVSYDETTKKMVYHENGMYTDYFNSSFYSISNVLNSDTYGFDWSISVNKIPAINTSFSTSTSFILSKENNQLLNVISLVTPVQINGENIWHALYKPTSMDTKHVITSKLNTTTHIPKIGFVVMTNTDVYWADKRTSQYKDKFQPAIGYLDRQLRTVLLSSDQENPLPSRNLNLTTTDQKMIYAIFSMSVAKEINKQIRIAVTAYNTFNIRPEYNYNDPDTGTEAKTVYGSPLSITGGISLKL